MKRLVLLVMLILLTLVSLVLSNSSTTLKRLGYEGIGRDDWQQPERVITTLEIKPGQTIADLGAGGGYFTFRLADATGPSGRVYAAEVDRGMVDYLTQRAETDGYKNVQVILGDYHDPQLPQDGVDLIFVCNTYHHLQKKEDHFAGLTRVEYMADLRKVLREGGRIAIVDFTENAWFPMIFGHITPVQVILNEMEAAGYRVTAEYDFLAKQSFLVFSK